MPKINTKHPPRKNKRAHSSPAAENKIAIPALQFPVVGVGASSGGLEAFTQLLKNSPVDTGMAFVLVQHLDPLHESALTHLLSTATPMPVLEVKNKLKVQPNHVYIIPPNMDMTITRGILSLTSRQLSRTPHRSIDSFFESLARDQRELAIGIVLSGNASDGTLGLEAIKAEGGITFAQDISAKYPSMPKSAIAAGCVDFVLSPQKIAEELGRIAQHPYVVASSAPASDLLPAAAIRESDLLGGPGSSPAPAGHATRQAGSRHAKSQAANTPAASPDDTAFKKILALLHNHSGVDFLLYKPNTIQRRIRRRTILNHHLSLKQYAASLQNNKSELNALYSDVLISVTSFFRNPEAFDVLKHDIFPKLLLGRSRDMPLRVWTLGCSTGQEAYSIAMAYAEFSETTARVPQLQIFATDLNEALLEKARHGLYPKTLAEDISPKRLRRFFVEEEGGFRINKALREQVIFARQNVATDPPFSRIDLVTCRNLLIYFDAPLQKKVMPAFHYALNPGGFLFLGASESIGQFTNLFEPADKKQKIFSRKSAPTPPFRLSLREERDTPASRPAARTQGTGRFGHHHPPLPSTELTAQREADRVMVNQFAPPGVLVNADFQILQFRGATGAYLQPPPGKATFDVLKMARDGLMLPLRAAINKAKHDRKPVHRQNIRVQSSAGPVRTVDINVIPLKNLKETYYLVLFDTAAKTKTGRLLPAVPSPAPLTRRELKAESHRIVELEQQISETRDYLQSIQEQHDSDNEELQSSNEEGQSANEELQSINEELETSKEELESTNEELITVNEELASRNLETSLLNADLNNLQVSINTAILLFSRDLILRRYTAPAAKIFNLLPADLGRPLFGLRHNLDLPDLESKLAEVIETSAARQWEVRDKDGHWYDLQARPYLTLDNAVDGVVLLLADIDVVKRAALEMENAHDYALHIIAEVPPLLILDEHLRVQTANDSFCKHFKVSPATTENCMVYDLGNGQWNIPRLRKFLEDILRRNSRFVDFEVEHTFENIGRRTMLLSGHRINHTQKIILSIDDITDRLESQAAMRISERRFRRLFEAATDGVILLDAQSATITDVNPFMIQILGYTRKELIGKELWEIGLLNDKQACLAAMRQLEKFSFIRYETLPLVSKDGIRHEVEVVANRYTEDARTVIQCNVRDITERITARQEREHLLKNEKLARDEAEAANRAKDIFLATLSHEIRTPLNAILGWASILQGENVSPDERREGLEVIERNCRAQAQLIEDLLDVSRIVSGKLHLDLKPCDLADVIKAAVDTVRPSLLAKDIRLVVNIDSVASQTSCDSTRMQQVFWNLLINAIKFTPRAGLITVSLTRDSSSTRVSISDNGQGINPDFLPFVFDRFRQADSGSRRKLGGLGLGLSIVKHIVELHGGLVTAHSSGEGQGSLFAIVLPIYTPAQTGPDLKSFNPAISSNPQTQFNFQPPANQPPILRPPTGNRLAGANLLIVDDDADALRLLKKILELEGAFVVPCQSATKALQHLEDPEQPHPDILISDLSMPNMDGLDLIRQVRLLETRKGIPTPLPAIALTGFAHASDAARALDAGFQYHMSKPINLDKMLQLLADLTTQIPPKTP